MNSLNNLKNLGNSISSEIKILDSFKAMFDNADITLRQARRLLNEILQHYQLSDQLQMSTEFLLKKIQDEITGEMQ